MTTHIYMRRIVAGALALSLITPSFVFAETAVDGALGSTAKVAQTSEGAPKSRLGVAASTTLSAVVMTRAKEKANKEISRRLQAISELSTKVAAMTKVKPEIIQSITTNLQNQTNLLNTLKSKIDADTDGATLKDDIKSITQSYRVFALMLPQAHITIAADREATILNMLSQLGAKLQARIQDAAQGGTDVAAMSVALTDMGTKVASGQTHAQTAITSIVALTPDGGDKDKMKANEAALQTARKEVQAAHQDFVAARKDVESILKVLKTIKKQTAATSTQE